jgi:RNA polymerase sigma-70 factor (ECF subfamily)
MAEVDQQAAQLMARYCDGDAGAFRELYALVAPKLYGYLVKLTRVRAVADDVLQQTFLKVHRARAAYIRGADPVPWIFAIAHRTFIDEARKAKRSIVRPAEDDALPEIPAGLDGLADESREPSPDRALVKAAFDALATLPEQQRQAVVLTKLEGKSVAEAAEIAGTTIGAMKVRAHRGYEVLRKALAGGTSRD